ncbi:MAG: hypothetical protein ACTSSP_00075 [Candidatus Asgardarchaeia archaeon]
MKKLMDLSKMILNIYIIHESGVCIFKREYSKETEVDEQLISGFLMAIRTFAQQTFLDGLQRIQLASRRTLIYGYNSDFGILAAVLSDKRDNPILVERLVNKIIDMFIRKYKNHLKPLDPRVERYSDFAKDIDNLLIKKIRSRDIISSVASITVAMSLSLIITYLMITMISIISTPLQLFLPVAIASLVGGYIGGNLKTGVISGLLSTIPILILLSTALIGLTTITLTLEDFIFVSQTLIGPAVIIGAVSGYIIDLTKLYPLE